MAQFQVPKNNFEKGQVVATPGLEEISLSDGEIVVKIDRFAYTANNITYAVVGEQMRYWQFFTPHGEKVADTGVIPVWGFADVVKSNVKAVPVGDRLFGYFPPATYLVMQPIKVAPHRLIDGMAHRQSLPTMYNNYSRVLAEPGYSKANDRERMLLFPLHMTSYFIWDALKEKEWYGAQQILILSASSKTSTGLAYALQQDEVAPKVIGLTSSKNMNMVNQTQLYDQVLPYEDWSTIDANIPTVIVDMSGNRPLLLSLYEHLGDQRTYCINVGLTHWELAQQTSSILAQRSEFFFAPSQIQKRMKEWGPADFQKKTIAFLMGSTAQAKQWLQFEEVDGLDEFPKVHESVCAGDVAADLGIVVVV